MAKVQIRRFMRMRSDALEEVPQLRVEPQSTPSLVEPQSKPSIVEPQSTPSMVYSSLCHWVDMKYSWLLSTKPSMCIRDSAKEWDFLSDAIRRDGKWGECDELLASEMRSDGIFVDAGANIGSCTVLMAGHKVRTHAFEPQPDNLYYFRATLAANEELSSWVTVHEVGLGDHAHNSTIYRQPGNAGNSVVGVAQPDHPGNLQEIQSMEKNKANISVSRLDDELWPDQKGPPPKIAVMKMDVQGYEVKVLRGAQRLLSARCIRAIKTEIAPAWLAAQGSTPLDLCRLLDGAGFALFARLGASPMSAEQCGADGGSIRELYAIQAAA
jgi:FkbM family methyltransferase